MNSSIGILLKNSAEAVITPLKNGIISLTRVYESLINADVDPITGQCTNYTAIRQQIVQTQQSLERSEQAANAGLKSLDEYLERLTADMGRLEQEITETERNLNNLRTEKSSSERSLSDSNCALDQARRHLASAEETLRSLEQRKREAEIKTGVGAGLFLIPIVGWIAGAVMVSVGAVELDQASHALGAANDEVRRSESELEKYRNKVSGLQQTISNFESQMRDKQVNLEHMNRDNQNVKQQREGVGEFQGKARKAVHLLNALSGKTKVVECQTRKFILQEPVMNVMEEVLNAAGAITGNELLCIENIPQLLNTMKENHQKLVAVCA